MTRVFRPLRRFRGWLVLAAAAATVAVLAFYVRQYVANATARAYLGTVPAPTSRVRLLVVAPHPDDDVLSSGGYLARTVAAGGQVRVVIATSGDGFRRAAGTRFHDPTPSPRDYIRLGEARQEESRAALRQLGVAPGRVSFLGFPDGGTRQLWAGSFTAARPYRSWYTRSDHVPYAGAYRPGAPYDGAALESEIADVIRGFRPTVVTLPDPNDFNSDHRAVGEFTMMALARLGDLRPGGPRVYFYLVHHGAWPTPVGDQGTAFLVPPADLYGVEHGWRALPIDRRVEAEKRRAITRYRSQMRVMGDWLLSFVRRNELFTMATVGRLPSLIGAYAFPQDGRPPGAAEVPAPEPRALGVTVPGTDLRACDLFLADRRLWALLSLAGQVSAGDTYRLSLRTVGPGGQGRIELAARHLRLEPPFPAGATFASHRHVAAFSVPLADLGGARYVYIAARADGAAATPGTPWTMFRLNPDVGVQAPVRR